MGLHAVLKMMPNRAQDQIALVQAKMQLRPRSVACRPAKALRHSNR
jgi:hypothetical protein